MLNYSREVRFRLEEAMEVWEGEGGAAPPAQKQLVGTEGQVAWAEKIRSAADREFDRVAKALESRGLHHAMPERTRAALTILEEKRAEVMAREEAGYFIREWQELHDQVRRMIIHDPRYQAVPSDRAAVSQLGGAVSSPKS